MSQAVGHPARDGHWLAERKYQLAALLFVLSLFLTVLTWPFAYWWVAGDTFQYMRLGENLWNGRGSVGLGGAVSFYFPPGYPLALGLLDLVLHDPATSGRVVAAIGSAFSVAAVFLLAHRWFGLTAALVGAILYLGLPLRIWYSSWVMTEGFYSGLALGAILAATAGVTVVGAAAAGLLVGLAYVTRPEGALLLLVVLPFPFLRRPVALRAAAARSTVMLAGFLVVLAPYLVYVYTQTGVWSPAGKFEFSMAWAHAEDLGVPLASLLGFDRKNQRVVMPRSSVSAEGLAQRYVRNARAEVRILREQLGPVHPTVVLLLIAALGMLAAVWSRRRPWIYLAEQGLACLPLLALPLAFVADRFLLPVVAMPLLWLGYGIYRVGDSVAARLGSRLWMASIVAVLTIVFLWTYQARMLPMAQPGGPHQEIAVAQALRQDARDAGIEHGRLMAREAAIPYYSGLDWVGPPPSRIQDTLSYARKQGVTHLVVTQDDPYWPAAQQLWNPRATPRGVVPVPVSSAAPSYRAFRIVPAQ